MRTVAAAVASLLTVACAAPAGTRTRVSALEIDTAAGAHQSDRIWVHRDEIEEGTAVNPDTRLLQPYKRTTRRLYSCYRPTDPGAPVCYEASMEATP
jgi:hypothetical protein